MRFVCESVTERKLSMLPRIIAGPLALTVTWETVKSVTFPNRLSQTPVSFFRLLMHVKERRFEVSSEGKRIGEMGQSINWKDVKVERDLRVVIDKATSSEQLANVREMTCLKGLEESQMVVEL